MRIVVTGATGNVGSQLLPQLLAHPHITEVTGIARRLSPDRDPRVQWHAADVAADDLAPVFRGADVVVHLAWLLQPAHSPAEMARVNLTGTRRVVDAVVEHGVPALVHASSVGVYSPWDAAPGARGDLRGEGHPTQGQSTSTYSRHKAQAERVLDELERDHPERRVVRLRPGVVLQAQAASELARYFLGPYLPQRLVRRAFVPVVPATPGLAIQAVHAADMARAYVLAATTTASGPFNIAAGPVLDPSSLAAALHAAKLPVPRTVLRALVDLSWRLHLQPTDPGWVDLGTRGPLMDTSRARDVLGWSPSVSATDALLEVVEAMGRRVGGASPVLRPRAPGLGRLGEVARALVPGARGTG